MRWLRGVPTMHDGSKLIDFDDLGGAGYQRTLKVIHCDSATS